MRKNVSKIVGRHLNECMYSFKFNLKKQSLVLDAYISPCIHIHVDNIPSSILYFYLLSLLLNIYFSSRRSTAAPMS